MTSIPVGTSSAEQNWKLVLVTVLESETPEARGYQFHIEAAFTSAAAIGSALLDYDRVAFLAMQRGTSIGSKL